VNESLQNSSDSIDNDLSSYDFELPEHLIAQRPAASRDAARLLVADSSHITHSSFAELYGFLRPGDLLVRNDTRVFPARIHGRRSGGGKTEFLLIYSLNTPSVPDADLIRSEILTEKNRCRWVVLARPTVHLKEDKVVTFSDQLSATVLQRLGGGRLVVEFSVPDDSALFTMLQILGEVPLPPYIKRDNNGPDEDDSTRYQTIYAKSAGAVAAPTAGLHFTPYVEQALQDNGINFAHVTLHVGPGTFRPIIADRLNDHRMDAEFYIISQQTADKINQTKERGGRIITVGTTSTRALEASALETGMVTAGQGWTRIFIKPGYRFNVIDGLITNFHLPRSSLLVMISALMGRKRVLDIYREAVATGYRFYSYGDATLLIP